MVELFPLVKGNQYSQPLWVCLPRFHHVKMGGGGGQKDTGVNIGTPIRSQYLGRLLLLLGRLLPRVLAIVRHPSAHPLLHHV